jgi:hypothetical protein
MIRKIIIEQQQSAKHPKSWQDLQEEDAMWCATFVCEV